MKAWVVFCLVSLCACTSHAFAKDGVLLVMFGTSYTSAQVALNAIEEEYKDFYKNSPVEVAYTSSMIRSKLEKRGEHIFSIDEALHSLADQGVSKVLIQSFHVAPAAEYNETERLIVKHLIQNPDHFTTAKLGAPLLTSSQDMHKVIEVILQALPKERQPEDAVVFMGHGNDHGPGDLVLQATAHALHAQDANVYLASVEGALRFDAVLEQLKTKKPQRVWLVPFMIVAGDHAVNDLAGSEADSWASQIRQAGMEVKPVIKGLGELEGIRHVFLEHSKNARVDMVKVRQEE